MLNDMISKKEVLLTDRQRIILGFMAKGLTNEAIAAELGISINTIKYHRKIIFGQLNAVSASQAVVIAMSMKLIEL